MDMRKLMIVGAGAIATFAGVCILVIAIATDPDRGGGTGAGTSQGNRPHGAESASRSPFVAGSSTAPAPFGDAAQSPTGGEQPSHARPEGVRSQVRGERYSRHGRSSEDD
jgi:hypothetical protein